MELRRPQHSLVVTRHNEDSKDSNECSLEDCADSLCASHDFALYLSPTPPPPSPAKDVPKNRFDNFSDKAS